MSNNQFMGIIITTKGNCPECKRPYGQLDCLQTGLLTCSNPSCSYERRGCVTCKENGCPKCGGSLQNTFDRSEGIWLH